MTVQEFRKHKFLPSQWRKELQTNGILQAVLQTMEENAPHHFAIPGDKNGDVSETRASLELGLTRGYSKYGDTLKLLASPIVTATETMETSYEPPPNIQQ